MTAKNARVRLTEYSHGAGCGCKIAPAVLDEILSGNIIEELSENLLVGNQSRDDAAVYDMGNGEAVISTTDFFMPIVDDAFDFGRIAATNAISDIYAMGGEPMMAIAILGWPVDRLHTSVARDVINGGRQTCKDAGIVLAGGHSIDAPEPIFGLAVTGRVKIEHLKRNDTAEIGDRLYLTKPLGIGILTTAEKKQLLMDEHQQLATEAMCQLNTIGALLAKQTGVTAMTDVTGFGLLGHLTEMCEGRGLQANINAAAVPRMQAIEDYLARGAIPGGTERNFASYGHKIGPISTIHRQLFCDPQTSGGLLVSVKPEHCEAVEDLFRAENISVNCIGEMAQAAGQYSVIID